MPAVAAKLLLVFLLGAQSAAGGEVWSREDLALSLSGSVKEILTVTRQTDVDALEEGAAALALPDLAACLEAAGLSSCPLFDVIGDERVVQSLTRLRTRADLEWGAHVSAVAIYDHSLLSGHIDTLEAQLGQGFAADTFLGAEDSILSRKHLQWDHSLYRGFIEIEAGAFDAVVGRQRVAWGVGRLWNPIDRFNAIPPLALEADQSAGVDAVLLRWNLEGFHFAEVVFAPGDRSDDSRYAARLHAVVMDSDISLMGGIFEEAPTVGADFARNLGGAAFRLEAVYTDPERKVWRLADLDDAGPSELPHFWQFVASLDYNFPIGDGVYALVEYLYNGNALGTADGSIGTLAGLLEASETLPGIVPPAAVPIVEAATDPPYWKPGSSALLGTSRVVTAVKHQVGMSLGYDLTPEVRVDFLTLVDCSRGSAAFFPALHYTPAGSVELTAGIQTFAGPNRSQYGGAETVYYALAEWFF